MTDYPVKFRFGKTMHHISVADAQKLAGTLMKQVDRIKDKERAERIKESEFNRIIGENIRRERGVIHATAAWLAKKSGLSVSFLSDVENGKRGISSANLVAIAQAVGCRFEDLLKGAI